MGKKSVEFSHAGKGLGGPSKVVGDAAIGFPVGFHVKSGFGEILFEEGDFSQGLLPVGRVADGLVQVTYRYIPEPLRVDTDIPDLPEWCHGALIGYAVGRERAAGDAASVNAARTCFELYNAAKRCMRAHRGELDAFTIENRI